MLFSHFLLLTKRCQSQRRLSKIHITPYISLWRTMLVKPFKYYVVCLHSFHVSALFVRLKVRLHISIAFFIDFHDFVLFLEIDRNVYACKLMPAAFSLWHCYLSSDWMFLQVFTCIIISRLFFLLTSFIQRSRLDGILANVHFLLSGFSAFAVCRVTLDSFQ